MDYTLARVYGMNEYIRTIIEVTGIAIKIPGQSDSWRVWDGETNLFFENKIWYGAANQDGVMLTVESIPNQIGLPDQRVKISLSINTKKAIVFWSYDLSGCSVDIGYIHSEDGISWSRLPNRMIGRLSQIKILNNILSAEVESWLGDIDRGVIEYWDDATHQKKYPGDTFFSRMAQLASGIEIRGWPP